MRAERLERWALGAIVALVVMAVAAAGASAAPVLTQASGSPYSVLALGVDGVAFSPTGQILAAAASSEGPTLPMFSVASDGTLTPVSGSPFRYIASSVAFSPSGSLLAAPTPGSISQAGAGLNLLSVATSGKLSPVSGSPFPMTGNGGSLGVAYGSGGLIAATATDDAGVSMFSVGPNDSVTQVAGSPFATGNYPLGVAFNPAATLLAVANEEDNTISLFSVGAGGVLTQVSGSPFATGNGPSSVAFSPSGSLLAVANSTDGTVSLFSVGAGGTLTPVSGSPFSSGNGTNSVAFSPDGALLATTNSTDDTVTLFSVSSTGALTPVPGSPFALAASSYPDAVAFNKTGHVLAVGDSSNSSVSTFTVDWLTDTVAPSITGNPVDGQTVDVSRGTWLSEPASTLTYAVQWQLCPNATDVGCTNLASTSTASPKLTSSDVGSYITVLVTATNALGQTAQAYASALVGNPPPPVNQTLPKITGTFAAGKTLKVSNGAWTSPDSLTYGYVWEDCNSSGTGCTPISPPATSNTYTLTSTDVLGDVDAVVTATDQENQSTPAAAPPVP
jgi:6-phosphogluconolactonase